MRLLAFDLETHLVQEGLAFPNIVCGSWASYNGAWLDREPVAYFVGKLGVPDTVWCGANIAFDFGCVLAVRPDLFPAIWNLYKEGRVFDVSIAATLNAIYDGRLKDGELWRRDGTRNQKGRYSLEEVVYECTGRKTAKENDRFRKSYALLEHLPTEEWPKEAQEYPVDDARNTLECAEYQARSYHNLQDMPRQCWAAFAMKLGSAWGMRTDPMAYEALATNIDDTFVKLEGLAAENGLMRAKVKKRPEDLSKDMAAIKERVFQAYDGQPPLTPTGETSTSREALQESGDPALESLAELGKWGKLKTYLPMLLQGTNTPINISPNSLVATGRASYDGLIQLIPKKGGVRQVFRARPGYVWSSVDYAAIEMSTLAQVCLWMLGESTLAESINADIDPHWFLGSQLEGVDYASTLALAKDKKHPYSFTRFASKACLAADTKVLTPRGWVPIVQVTTQDKVWDGEQWVSHQGLIFQGIQPTENFEAVEATADHGVLTGLGWREWTEVRTNPSLFQSALSLATLPSQRGSESFTKESQRVSAHELFAAAVSSLSRQGTSSSTSTQHDAENATKVVFGPSGTSSMQMQCLTRAPEHDSSTGSTQPRAGVTIPRTETTRATGLEGSESPTSGSTTEQRSSSTSQPCRGTTIQTCRWIESTTTEATSPATSDSAQLRRTSTTEKQSTNSGIESENSKQRSPVYDLLNAGPNHRFTILTSRGALVVSNCNFGFPGMMGPAKFVVAKRHEGLKVCEWFHRDGKCGEAKVREWGRQVLDAPLCRRCIEEAAKLRQQFITTWREMRPYWNKVTSLLDANGDRLEHFVSKRVRGGLSAPAGANTLFQGLAADGAKAAVIALTEEMYLDTQSPLFGSRLMVFAHDETILEIPEEKAHEAALRQAEIMVTQMKLFVPDVKVKAEPALMYRWDKDADAVYKEGRLVPWQPSKT